MRFKKKFNIDDGSDFIMNYEVISNVLPETTVFIHGNFASNRWWYPAVDVWAKDALENNHNLSGDIILAEFRGCGESSDPKDASEVRISNLAQDFLSLINSLEYEKVNLVGHSTGGHIAALMMARDSKRKIAKAILLDPVGVNGVHFDLQKISAFEMMKLNRGLVSVVMNTTIYQNKLNSDFFNNVIVEDAFRAAKSVGSWILRALGASRIESEMNQISIPVLILHGEFDTILPLSDSLQLSQLIKNCKFTIVKNHGHCLNVEDPFEFTRIANLFFFTTPS